MAIPAFPVDEKCGANAEFRVCGSACVPTCASPEMPEMCTMQCVMGCFCRDGFLKNAKGDCVPKRDCDGMHHALPFQKPGNMLFAYPPEMTQCKDNEMFLRCGSACTPTCAQPHPSPVCTKNCVAGCFCKPGYLKDEQGVCTRSENCGVKAEDAMPMPPQVCGENEEFRQCKGCDGTCKNPNPMCPRICIQGCACKEGHLRSETGKCVMTRECGPMTKVGIAIPEPESFMMLPPIPKCGDNEVFHSCGTACPATCATPIPSPKCTRNCVIGCFCKEGHLKNAKGVCVPAANCEKPEPMPLFAAPMTSEKKCASDREMYTTECGNQLDCMATCGTPLPFLIHGYPQVPKKCSELKCAPSCVCMHPYVRNTKGQCVERVECDHATPFTTTTTATTTH
jgi:hypothetical protein